MDRKISNFRLAEVIIKAGCKIADAPFVDLQIIFEKESPISGYGNGKIIINNSSNSLIDTIGTIVISYFDNFKSIVGKDLFKNENHKNICCFAITHYLNKLSDKNKTKDSPTFYKRLYQYIPVWLMLKDIISPIFEKEIDNCLVLNMSNKEFDITEFSKEYNKNEDSACIFLNSDITYAPLGYASLLIEAIKSLGLCPLKTIQKLKESIAWSKFEGLASLEFDTEEKYNDFISFVLNLSGVENTIDKELYDTHNKTVTAQAGDDRNNPQWWNIGIIERMLSPTRGFDFEVQKSMKPFEDELNKKIEEKKKEQGREGINYEMLLRIKDEEVNTGKYGLIMEKLLAPNRIW